MAEPSYSLNPDENNNSMRPDGGPMTMAFDPADPLLLAALHGAHSQTGGGDGNNNVQPDWAALSAALWATEHDANMNSKAQQQYTAPTFADIDLDFDLGLAGMDGMGAMGMYVDPTSFQAGPDSLYMYGGHPTQMEMPTTPVDSMLPTDHLMPNTANSGNPLATGRRLSVTSSSSSSGASLSPILDHASIGSVSGNSPPPPPMMASDDFAAFIRTLSSDPAILNGDYSSLETHKLSLPRLAPAANLVMPTTPTSHVTHGFSSTGTSTPASASTSSRATSSSPPSMAHTMPSRSSRPKTDHTTIERRYRTNLNARITALKKAVPALRVLEPTLVLPTDQASVDERGFIDGVRVARKVSKGNVLGKAVEYIRVLKKREIRLAKEYAGLKALLVSALPGGSQLLAAWEHEWRSQHGGPERDEVDGESSDAEDEGDDDAANDDEEEGDRPRKRARPTADKKSKPSSATTDPNAQERRKRGRPRKNAAPLGTPVNGSAPVSVAPPPVMPEQQQQQQQTGPPQYLLAAFAFFSFMRPLTPSSSSSSGGRSQPHSHQGHVLGGTSSSSYMPTPPSASSGLDLEGLVHIFHLVVSAAVFASIVLPWLPKVLARMRSAASRVSSVPVRGRLMAKHQQVSRDTSKAPGALSSVDSSRGSSDEDSPPTSPTRENRWAELSAAVDRPGAPDEAALLRRALGVRAGVVGLALQGLHKASTAPRPRMSLQRRQLEQRAWVRLGELVALSPMRDVGVRLQTYLSMRAHTDAFKASGRDLATLALLVRPLSSAKAEALWMQAKAAGPDRVRAHELLALQQLGVEQAAVRVREALEADPGAIRKAPLVVLGEMLVREGIARCAARMFVCAVRDSAARGDEAFDDGEDEEAAAEERMMLVRAGEEASGPVRTLAKRLRRALSEAPMTAEELASASTSGRGAVADSNENDNEGDEESEEVAALLSALGLFRRVFPARGVVVSAPAEEEGRIRLALRTALGAGAFERRELGVELEEMRDRAVDMVVERERGLVR